MRRWRTPIRTTADLLERVVIRGECWEWAGQQRRRIYPTTTIGGRNVLVHRLAYEITCGAIPPGMQVCHRCDNPKCARPDHLFLGTAADNIADKVAKQRQARGSRQGSARLTEADVVALRSEWRRGGVTQAGLGKRFGVGESTVHKIVHRQTWRHLAEVTA